MWTGGVQPCLLAWEAQGRRRNFQNAGAHDSWATSPSGKKGRWKLLPIRELSDVTGPPTEPSVGSQGALRAHLEWREGACAAGPQTGGRCVLGRCLAPQPSSPLHLPVMHTCWGPWHCPPQTSSLCWTPAHHPMSTCPHCFLGAAQRSRVAGAWPPGLTGLSLTTGLHKWPCLGLTSLRQEVRRGIGDGQSPSPPDLWNPTLEVGLWTCSVPCQDLTGHSKQASFLEKLETPLVSIGRHNQPLPATSHHCQSLC